MEKSVDTIDRRSLAVLSSGHLCIDLCQGAVPAFLPFLVAERHLTYAAAAGLVLATNIASSVVQPLFGQFADRFSVLWLMPVGLLLGGAGLALTGLVPGYWDLVFALMLCGIGIAAFHPEASRLVNAIAQKRRATSMSIFSVGGSLGFAVGPLLTTAILVSLGLRGSPLLLLPEAAFALIIFVNFSRFLPYSGASKTRKQVQDTAQQNAWGAFTLLTAVVICRSIVFYGLNTFLPLYWIGILHQTKAEGNIALTCFLAVGIVGTLIGGRLADRYGRRIIVLIALIGQMPAVLLFAMFAPLNPLLALLLLAPVSFTLFAPFSTMVVMGQEYLPGRVGTASGVTLGLALTVGGIAVPLFGYLADVYGLQVALLSLAIVPVIGVVLAFMLPRPPLAVARQEAAG
jgi:FSR family fosmidomycin resistance protein-like MFS transporter